MVGNGDVLATVVRAIVVGARVVWALVIGSSLVETSGEGAAVVKAITHLKIS